MGYSHDTKHPGSGRKAGKVSDLLTCFYIYHSDVQSGNRPYSKGDQPGDFRIYFLLYIWHYGCEAKRNLW